MISRSIYAIQYVHPHTWSHALFTNAKFGKDTKIVIFYGTQSGTAQRLAQSLGQAIDRRFSQKACVASLSDYDSPTIANIDRDALVILILSTYGEGDPPDNAYDFADWLRTGLSDTSLSGLRFAMLGIGSSNYKWYNQFSRTAFEYLCKADAVPIIELGLADDAQGMTDEGYFNWTTKLFECLVTKLEMAEQIRPYKPSLTIQPAKDTTVSDSLYIPRQLEARSAKAAKAGVSPIRLLPVSDARTLTDSPDRPFVHLDIDISGHPDIKYLTGDHIAIWPENEEAEVDALCQQLGVSKEDTLQPLEISKATPGAIWNPVWSDPVTLNALFSVHMDITAAVSRELIQDLKGFAPSVAAKTFLQSMSASRDAYMKYRSSKRITIASVLRDASPGFAWQIPLSFLLERIPPMRPRYYSIASAASVHPRKVSITVSVKTILLENPDTVHRGLASHYLHSMSKGSSADRCGNEVFARHALSKQNIWCHLRRSKLKLPVNLRRPMIMIATGSGIAPFRGFIQHAVKQFKLGHDVGQLVVFFGSRTPDEHLYKDELESAVAQLGEKLHVLAAYSRFGEKPCHVQDKIDDGIEWLSELLLDQEASMYICGSTAMARSVSLALSQGLCRQREWTADQFAAFESDAKRSRRWQEDVWG